MGCISPKFKGSLSNISFDVTNGIKNISFSNNNHIVYNFTTFIGKINVYILLGVLSIVLLFMSPMTSYSTHISAAFAKYDSVATLSGILNAMASLGIVVANYVFARIADNSGWVVTSNVWVVLLIAATVLAFMAVPAWRKFIKK